MMKTLTQLLIISCLLAPSTNAQLKKREPGESNGKEGKSTEFKPVSSVYQLVNRTDGTFKVISFKLASGKVVKGAPYSATATTETIQRLSDGNQIIRKNESKVYRDSEGRTRTEQTLETIGKWTADGEAPKRIFINDPVAGSSYSVDPRTRALEFTLFRKAAAAMPAMEDSKKPGSKPEVVIKQSAEKPVRRNRPEQGSNIGELTHQIEMLSERARSLSEKVDTSIGQKKTESLGTQNIEGVTAEGTRSTLTIPAAGIGNTLPLEIVDETWYSPELQITVMTKHRDPRTGETTYKLTNLNRSEPDPSLFQVPADIKVRRNKPQSKPLDRREP